MPTTERADTQNKACQGQFHRGLHERIKIRPGELGDHRISQLRAVLGGEMSMLVSAIRRTTVWASQ
jgi:hypothetical protein